MRHVDGLDYGVIVFYLVLMLAIGLYFKARVKGALDYFAGGNLLPWWVSGISLYMSSFSAWTFSGAAGFVYEKGYYALMYFATWSLAFFIGYRFTAHLWRRARVISPVEYAAERYNVTTQQFVSWIMTLSGVLSAGITLTAVSKIIASTLGLDQIVVTLVVGVVMLLYTYLGGLWGVAVTDVVQFVILVASTVVILPLSLHAAGGLDRVLRAAPPLEFDFVYHGIHYNVHWLVGVTIVNIVNAMSLLGAQRYYSVLDERAAKKVGLSASLLFLTVPILFGIPPLAGRVFWPNLESIPFFQGLHHASDVIYVGLCLKILPNGLIGLFLAAMFAATMSALDTTFNLVSAVISRDVYKGVFRPDADDRELFFVGKIVTLVVGSAVIGLAVWYSTSQLGIFNLMAVVIGLFHLPMTIPMAVGLLSKRVARWSALAGMAWGLISSITAQYFLRWPIGLMIYAGAIPTLAMMLASPYLGELYRKRRGTVYALAIAFAGTLWFALPETASDAGAAAEWGSRAAALALGASLVSFSRLFARETEQERQMVEAFFRRLATPVDVVHEVLARGARESSPFTLVGRITTIVGGLVLVLLIFPPGRDVWPANVALGAVLTLGGWAMTYFGRKSEERFFEMARQQVAEISSPFGSE